MNTVARRSGRSEGLTGRWVLLVWVGLLTGLQGHYRVMDRRWHPNLAHGSSLAAFGCLHGPSATAEQWRSIAGVGKRLAVELAQHCRDAPCSAAQPPQGLRGLGPVLTDRVSRTLCAEPPADVTSSQAI